jgi:hypothetical protein
VKLIGGEAEPGGLPRDLPQFVDKPGAMRGKVAF